LLERPPPVLSPRCPGDFISAALSVAAGMRASESCTTEPSFSLATTGNSDFEISALADEKSQEAVLILQERGKRSNPLATVMRVLHCKACIGDQLRRQDSDMSRLQSQNARSPLTKMLFQLVPLITWLPKVDTQTLKADLIAGVTVGVMAIPQSMSYANIAGLPYVYGMYSACLAPLVYGFFGRSRHLAVGPSSIVSLLLQAGLLGKLDQTKCGSASEQDDRCPSQYAALAFLTAAVVGVLQIVGSILKLGFLVNFLGHPVTSGFTSGAAIITGMSQVKHMFGYYVPKSQFVYDTVGKLAQNIESTNVVSLVLGVCWLSFLVGSKKLARQYKVCSFLAPFGPLISCAVGIILLWLAPQLRENFEVKFMGDIPGGLMPFSATKWDLEMIPEVLPAAIGACFIGYTESFAIGKHLATKHGYEIDAGQEMFALGLSNFIGAMFSSFPVAGSFSRSALNESTGAQSQLSGLVTSITMFCTLMFLTPLFYYLPKFVLAAIVISSVISLIALSEARRLFHVKKSDFVLWVVAFLGTLFLGVLQGLAVAVCLSLVIVIYESVRPQITILWRIPGTTIYRNMKQESSGSFIPNVLICRIGSSMYFANASFIKDMLLSYATDLEEVNRTEYIILEMTPVVTLDITAIHVIRDIVSDLRSQGIQTAFAMVGNRVDRTMRKAKLQEFIGKQWFFPTVNEAVHYCLHHQHVKRKSLVSERRASEISGASEHGIEVGASCQLGAKLGFSNDLHHACTMVFLSLAKDIPMIMSEITALFRRSQLTIVRAQIEPLSDESAKHTYFLKSGRTGTKLTEVELEKVRRDLETLVESHTVDISENAIAEAELQQIHKDLGMFLENHTVGICETVIAGTELELGLEHEQARKDVKMTGRSRCRARTMPSDCHHLLAHGEIVHQN